MNGLENQGRCMPLWIINDALEKDRLTYQLKDIKNHGIDEVIIHPRYGLPKETYLSNDWFWHVGVILKEAKELCMGIWFYDELNWPSGTAAGRVTTNPNFAAKVCWEQDGKVRVRQSKFRTAYDRFPYVDALSSLATQSFIDSTYEEYYQRFPEYFGDVIRGFYHDERGMYANFLNAVDKSTLPYSEDLETTHLQLHNIPFNTDVVNIYRGSDQAGREARLRFFQSTGDLYVGNLKRLQEWCNHHGVYFIGHLLIEEDPLELIKTQADPFRALSIFDIPGCDIIGGYHPEKQTLSAQFARSVAASYGKTAVHSEVFGAFGKNLTSEKMKEVLRWQVQNGTTVIVPHALFYSTSGDRAFECPPSLMNGPIWGEMPNLIKYFQSELAKKIESTERDAVYFPVKAIQSAYNPRNPEEAKKIANTLVETCSNLYRLRIPFAVLDDEGVNNRLSQHQRLYVPESTLMPLETLDQIAKFSNEGGNVIFSGGKPEFAEHESEQRSFEHAMEKINPDRTEEIDGIPSRRLNIWKIIEPTAAAVDYKIWSRLSPAWADRYSRTKGKIEIATGYVSRRFIR